MNKTDKDVEATLIEIKKRQKFKRFFHQVASDNNAEIVFESEGEPGRNRGVDGAILNLANCLQDMGVYSILTSQGYRHYIGNFSPKETFPQLPATLGIMFYLGSITRYKPYDFDKIIDGKYSWLVNEFLKTQPMQFLYCLASFLSGVDVVRPYAIS
jgi:YaaC-like Protein